MSTGGENESADQLPVFRPFTREELAVIENRIREKKLAAKKRAERRARNIAVSICCGGHSGVEVGFFSGHFRQKCLSSLLFACAG